MVTQKATETHSTVDASDENASASAGNATLTLPPSSVDASVPMEITDRATHLFVWEALTRSLAIGLAIWWSIWWRVDPIHLSDEERCALRLAPIGWSHRPVGNEEL